MILRMINGLTTGKRCGADIAYRGGRSLQKFSKVFHEFSNFMYERTVLEYIGLELNNILTTKSFQVINLKWFWKSFRIENTCNESFSKTYIF